MDSKFVLALTEGAIKRMGEVLSESESDDKKVARVVANWKSYGEFLESITKRPAPGAKEAETVPTLKKVKKHKAEPVAAPAVVVVHDQPDLEKRENTEAGGAEDD